MKKTIYVVLGIILVLLMAALLYFLQDLQSAKETVQNVASNQSETAPTPISGNNSRPGANGPGEVSLNSSVDVDDMRLFVPDDWIAEKQILDNETKVLIRTPDNHQPLPLTLEVIIRDKSDPRTVPFGNDYQRYIKTLGRYSVNVIAGSSKFHDPSRKVFTIQERTYYFDESNKRYFIILRYYSSDINPDIEVLADEIIRNGIY